MTPRARRGANTSPNDAFGRRSFAAAYDTETATTLRIALLIIGSAAVIYLPVNLTRPVPGARDLALLSAFNAVAGLGGWWWTRRHPVPDRYAHAVFASVIATASISSALMQARIKDPMLMTHVVIIIVSTGMVLVAWQWAAASAALSVVTWCFIAGPTVQSDQLRNAVASLSFGLAAGAMANVGRRSNIDRLLRANEELERAAVVDSLTEVYNRRGLELVASHVVRTARRTGETVGVLVVDIDNFKSVNDSLGHQAGDRVLLAVARALTTGGRDSDVVARWGGDEFVVITLGSPPPADDLAARVERQLVDHGITGRGGCRIRVSVGAANVTDVAAANGIEQLISAADDAMYAGRATRRGGAAVVALSAYQNQSTGQNLSTGR